MDLPLLNVDFSEQFPLPKDTALEQRLGLYQVFLRLYEQNRPLLDEILSLEGANGQFSVRAADAFVQGLVNGQQVLVITNLLGGTTQAIQQPENIWTIGRSKVMALPVPDRRLSRRHAALQYLEGEGFYLVDLGSTNGSYVNGERVYRRVLLQDGDRVRLSNLAFRFGICQFYHQRAAVSPAILAQIQAAALDPPSPPRLDPIAPPMIESAAGDLDDPLDETFSFLQ